ncbi:hypothetical protein AAE478_005303 [Parahypoxylon ruwenzoriense]
MSSSNQPTTSPSGVVDPLDLFDFSEYDARSYPSPTSTSPTTSNKSQFVRTPTAVTTPTTMPTSQTLSGPSHQYDRYKQQTPFVPGALASTLAINQNNAQITGYTLEYMPPDMSSNDDMFDFNSTPQTLNTVDMDLDFDNTADAAFFFPDQTVNPNAISGAESQTLPAQAGPSQTGNVGRMYPGMHQQAALAKARQQQHIIQQQNQNHQNKQHRPKAPLPSDPIVEQKITQLLNSMRSKATPSEVGEGSPMMQVPRPKKEEDDMDEDERLLASEEGKKLSSKERRQLRNKVSARAFRSRRKEYITQLESEIANKVTENGDLRAQNRVLMEENRRLSDLSRMLLSSPSFSNFLDHLSSNPATAPQQPPQPEQRQPEPRQVSKDVNPFPVGQQNHQHQQIGMVMIPEQTMDFSMLNLNSDAFNYQPQVFTVLETPEVPVIDTEALAGKTTNFVAGSFALDSEKAEAPIIESPVLPLIESESTKAPAEAITADNIAVDLDGDIYDGEEGYISTLKPIEPDTDRLTAADVFGDIEPEKALARYELVESSEEDVAASIAERRIAHLTAGLQPILARLELLTIGL